MGYGMAQNIRKKLPPEAILTIYDINRAALEKFVSESEGTSVVAESAYTAAMNAVGLR